MPNTEEADYSLVYPFIACESKGGPYRDKDFVAGFRAGMIDTKLKAARLAGATVISVPVEPDLVKQLELIGMDSGFPHTEVQEHDEWRNWVTMTFSSAPVRA